MRFITKFIITFGLFVAFTGTGFAMDLPGQVILKTDYKIWTLYPSRMDWFSDYNKAFFDDFEIKTLEEEQFLINDYLEDKSYEGIDTMKLRNYLESTIAPEISREREDVTIDIDAEGNVIFEGHGLFGRELDLEKATMMLKYALENNIEFLTLPIIREDPVVTVLSEDLQQMGIQELVSGGETNFSGSPYNRINNINVGLSKFNGHIINPGEEFVFGDVLGEVDESTGYKPELVIKGDKTVPEYGGGLCQVSTTTYRAALAAGFPVTMRKNHSYAVSYYTPHGLDATVYPPSPDLKFINDSPAHILMQSFTIDKKAYYNFYGTKDDRDVFMIGPYYSGWTSPPATKTQYSNNLAPGEVEVLGHAVPGLTSTWYRHVLYKEKQENENSPVRDFLETIFSKYQARPDYYIIGAEAPAEVTENGY
ncbi:VanW family protein [Patescibacteria group bacterium]|nr:VanW family protein [Patescibacteria group bacterium]